MMNTSQAYPVSYSDLDPYKSSKHIALLLCGLLVIQLPLNFMYPSEVLAGRSSAVEVADRTISQGMQAFTLGLMLVYIVLTGINPGQYGFKIGTALGLLASYMLLTTLLPSGGGLAGRLYVFIKSAYWMIGAIVLYRLCLGGALTMTHIRVTAVALTILGSYHTIVFCLSPESQIGQNAEAYLLVWCIPLILLSGPSVWSSLLVVLASIAIIVTCKRGAMLALIAGLVAYAVTSTKLFPLKFSFRKVLPGLLLIGTAITVGIIWQMDNLLYRFTFWDSPDTIGSGRGFFYRVIFLEWYHSNFIQIIFGKGFFTVPSTTGKYLLRAVYAHSDWLEILHDMGLVGTGLFIFVHVRIISIVRQLWRLRHPITAPLVMAYTSFAMINVYSQCVIGYTNTIFFGLLLGYGSAAIRTHKSTQNIYL